MYCACCRAEGETRHGDVPIHPPRPPPPRAGKDARLSGGIRILVAAASSVYSRSRLHVVAARCRGAATTGLGESRGPPSGELPPSYRRTVAPIEIRKEDPQAAPEGHRGVIPEGRSVVRRWSAFALPGRFFRSWPDRVVTKYGGGVVRFDLPVGCWLQVKHSCVFLPPKKEKEKRKEKEKKREEKKIGTHSCVGHVGR